MKLTVLTMSAVVITLIGMSCGQSGGNAPSLSSLAPGSPVGGVPNIPTDGTSYFALVYGASASDRQLLSNRIAGYQAPGLQDVFANWRRIAGNNIYNTPADIPNTPAYCSAGGLNATTHNWNPSTDPGTGQTIDPGTYSACVNSNSFVSMSWSYVNSPDSLYNAANSTSFNGFISGIKFKNYTIQSTVSSTNDDDDGIGIIIAAYVDVSGTVHTLTAMRSQGGMAPSQGWAILYRQNNTIPSGGTFGEKSVGGVNPGAAGQGRGWSGKRTIIRVERQDDIITAYTSTWGTGSTPLSIEPTSQITIDLSTVPSLAGFRGEQYYGYGAISQIGASFADIAFTTPNAESDPSYIYDLLNNTVYNKQVGGGYVLVNGMEAYSTIGFPKRVKNTETSKEFTIDSASHFTPL